MTSMLSELMESFRTVFGLLLLLLGIIVKSHYGKLWKNDADRKRWIGTLIQDGFRNKYKRFMGGFLDAIDDTLSADEKSRGLSPMRTAWSNQLLSYTLLLAVAYPILSITVQWLNGTIIMFGDQTVLDAGTPQARIFVGFWLGSSVFLYVLSGLSQSRLRTALFITATAIVFVGLAFADRFHVPSAVAFAVAFTVAVAFIGAVTVAFTVAVAFIGAVTVAFTVAVAFIGAVTVAFAVAFIGAVIGTVTVAFAVAFIGAVLTEHRNKHFGPHPKRLITLIGFYLFGLSLAIIFGKFDPSRDPAESVFIILTLGALPLFNAIADFASIGLTRYLLRKGLTSQSSRRALFDLLLGGAIFATLGCAIITWLYLVQPSDGPLINLASFFTSIRANPSDYWWLAIMLGSTLLPTMMHGILALFTVLLTYPEPLRRWLVAKLESGATSDIDGQQATWVICALMSFAIWFPIFCGWLLVKMDHSSVLNGVIAFFETYARLIGAI